MISLVPFSNNVYQPNVLKGIHTINNSELFSQKLWFVLLISGLYPGKHGIIGKQFYDPDIPRGTNQGRGIFFDYRDQVIITLRAKALLQT